MAGVLPGVEIGPSKQGLSVSIFSKCGTSQWASVA